MFIFTLQHATKKLCILETLKHNNLKEYFNIFQPNLSIIEVELLYI